MQIRNLIAKLNGTADGMSPYWSEVTANVAEVRQYHRSGASWSKAIGREVDYWTREGKSRAGWKLERLSRRLRRVASRLDSGIVENEVHAFVDILTMYNTEKAKTSEERGARELIAPAGSNQAATAFSAGRAFQRLVDTAS